MIEAKNSDLEQGFKQLAVELLALDQWVDEPASEVQNLYGIISIGTVWRFGILNREQQLIIQDLNLFRVPEDVENLLRVMIALLRK